MKSTATQAGTKDLILDATDRLLARYGYRKMTMDDLAQEVGIGKGTIYLHFQSKEELVLSHIDRVIDRVIDGLKLIQAGRGSPAEKIRAMLVLRVMLRFDSVQHFTESLSEVLRDLRSSVLQKRQGHFISEGAIFAKVLRAGEGAGIFSCQDCSATAHALLEATNSLLPFNLSTRELGKREEVKTRVERIADLLLDGLVLGPVRTTRPRKT
jgi:AcrR family transcriptional regulator